MFFTRYQAKCLILIWVVTFHHFIISFIYFNSLLSHTSSNLETNLVFSFSADCLVFFWMQCVLPTPNHLTAQKVFIFFTYNFPNAPFISSFTLSPKHLFRSPITRNLCFLLYPNHNPGYSRTTHSLHHFHW